MTHSSLQEGGNVSHLAFLWACCQLPLPVYSSKISSVRECFRKCFGKSLPAIPKSVLPAISKSVSSAAGCHSGALPLRLPTEKASCLFRRHACCCCACVMRQHLACRQEQRRHTHIGSGDSMELGLTQGKLSSSAPDPDDWREEEVPPLMQAAPQPHLTRAPPERKSTFVGLQQP